MTAEAQFRDFIAGLGFEPPERLLPGVWTSFSANGKASNTAGRAKLFNDCEGGIVYDWRSGESWTWHVERTHARTDAELKAWRDRCDRAKHEEKAERDKQARATAEKARNIWAMAKPADDAHPYLTAKGVRAHGLRLYQGSLTLNGMHCDGALIVPACDGDGNVHSLSFIASSGEKRYLAGPRPAGCHFLIGNPADTLLIAEGYATGASLHEATGHAVAIAFDAGNLEPTARAIRQRFPEFALIVCADDDAGSPGNPGVTKATAAARAADALIAIPDFGEDRPEGTTDFNDLAAHVGVEAVQRCVACAKRPGESNPQPPAEKRSTAAAATRPMMKARTPVHVDGARAIFRRFSEIEARAIRWLWPGRIARGKVSMIAGNPGLGKSQITASMAAIITRGGTWPVDRTPCEQGTVVFLSAEDDAEDTIRPRLEAAGADLSRCVILDAVVDGYSSTGDEVRRSFNLKTDLGRLAEALVHVGDVAMVVIDPISAYLGGADSHNNAEIRALLAPLSEMASQHGAAIVGVSHLNKGGNNEALMRVTGSLAFVAAARSAFIVVGDKDAPDRRLFLPLKNNLGRDREGLAFAIHGATLTGDTGRIESSKVVWEGAPVTITADEAMAPALDAEERSELDDARAFIADLLSVGPVPAKRVQSEATGAGHSWATVRRASKALGVESTKDGMAGPWLWRLPPKMLKKSEDAQPGNVSTFARNEHLRLVPPPAVATSVATPYARAHEEDSGEVRTEVRTPHARPEDCGPAADEASNDAELF